MPSLSVRAGGQEFFLELPGEAAASPKLLQLIYLSGLFEPPPLCAGLALCGRCRVRFLPESPCLPEALPEDLKALGCQAVEQGWRLACRHLAVPGLRLELPSSIRLLEPVSLPGGVCQAGGDTASAALAVDYGSTSLHYATVPDLSAVSAVPGAGPEISAKIAVNPQIGAGSDIISRLAFAQRAGGLEQLGELSRAALRRMLAEAVRDGHSIREICLAANPAMVYLLLGLDVSGLAAAPYRLDYKGGKVEELPGLPPLWTAPLMGPFMGGDLSAGYAALAYGSSAAMPLPGLSRTLQGQKLEYPFLLADLGTNGEFVLALDENTALAASLPLGPALEGIGMSCGSEARPGVITNFALTSNGLLPQMFGQSSPTRGLSAMPHGLSGTAFLSLASHLLSQGLLRADGLFTPEPGRFQTTPLASRLARAMLDKGAGRAFYLSPSLYMSGADVEELLKIKAAFTLALKLLLQTAGLKFSEMKKLYLAGALGLHADVAALEKLGFIPAGSAAKVLPAGNTSLAGAALLCLRPELRPALVDWAARVQVRKLTDAPEFQSVYTNEMHFSW